MRKKFRVAIFISICLVSGQPGFAQDSKLIAEAKKEGGKVLVYSSMETSIAESVGNAFKNKTGIEMEFWRASSTKVMDRALNEHRAGRPLADVVVTIADPMLIATDEIPIAITLVHYTYVFGQSGAPLDYVRLPKMLGDGNYIALNNKAPRPNAGKLFIDYFLDDESMKIMARLGEFVNRTGIYPPLPDAEKIQFVPMDKFDTKTYAEKKKEF